MTAVDPMVIEELGSAHPLARHIGDFLTDLANAGASAHTLRAYRGDLAQFAAHHDGEIGSLDAATIRAYLADAAGLAPFLPTPPAGPSGSVGIARAGQDGLKR